MPEKKPIEELEELSPCDLGKLIIDELHSESPDIEYIDLLVFTGADLSVSGKLRIEQIKSSKLGEGDLVEKGYKFMPYLPILIVNGNLIYLTLYLQYYDIFEILLKAGADLNTFDRTGRTALHHAVSYMNVRIIKILLEKDADVSIKDTVHGKTPWDFATPGIRSEFEKLNPLQKI